jgi:hypothetical protein
MNEKGDIGSISGINEMMEKMTANASGLGPMTSGISGAFDEDNFQAKPETGIRHLPRKTCKTRR